MYELRYTSAAQRYFKKIKEKEKEENKLDLEKGTEKGVSGSTLQHSRKSLLWVCKGGGFNRYLWI